MVCLPLLKRTATVLPLWRFTLRRSFFLGRGSGGHSCIIRDEIRVFSSTRQSLSAALNELLAVDVVLILSPSRTEQLLRAEQLLLAAE